MIDLRRFCMPSACFCTDSSSTFAQICWILRLSGIIVWVCFFPVPPLCVPHTCSSLASWRATLREGRIRCDLGRFVRAIHSSLVLGDAPSCTNVQLRLREPISCRNQVLLSSEVHDTWAPSRHRCTWVTATLRRDSTPHPHGRILLHLQSLQRRYALWSPRPNNLPHRATVAGPQPQSLRSHATSFPAPTAS